MKLFDTHAHLADEQFDADRDAVIQKCLSEDVHLIMECATEEADFEKVMAIAHAYPCVYAAIGVHPHCAGSFSSDTLSIITELAKDEKVCAIGEIGLDYHYDFHPRPLQINVLERQLELALELDLPVSLHSREATEDMLCVLKNARGLRGVMHCFSGSIETAETLLDLGLHLGFGGTITFKNAKKGIEVAKITPIDRILLETDCPYLAPVPLRGTRNIPANTRYAAEKLAEIKGISADELSHAAFDNAIKLFNISKD